MSATLQAMKIVHACLPLLVFLLSAALPTAHAQQAQRLNRCTDGSGQSVYTDRPCETLGARARMPEPTPAAGNTQHRDQLGARCPRRLSELVGALRSATASNDVNRLSSLYLWGSVSDAGAQRILGQLESIARRPLVDMVPVYPQVQDPTVPAAEGVPAIEPNRPNPIALRLEQVLPGTVTPASTVLGLRRQYGCFWITL